MEQDSKKQREIEDMAFVLKSDRLGSPNEK